MAGCVLLLVRLAASFVLYSALWTPGQLPSSIGLPSIPFLLLQASLWLGPAATLLLATSTLFSEDKRRLGAVLLGLGICGQPLVFAYETLPGEDFYLSGATVLLLGWPSGGINLPEAALFALLALLLLRLQGGGPPRPRGARGSGSFMLCSGFGRQSTPMAPWRSQWGPPAKLRRELCRATDQAHHPPPLRRLDEPIR